MTTPTQNNLGAHVWTFASAGNGDSLQLNRGGALAAMQVTAISGATVTLEGSNDGTTWIALEDINGDAISLTTLGYVELSTSMIRIRPVATGGTATVAISVRG